MVEYVTREDIVAVGANALTDLYDDADPGVIQCPIGHISQIIAAGQLRVNAESEQGSWAVRFTGDAVTGNPVVTLGAGGFGAAGTGTSQTTSTNLVVLNVDISVKQGSILRMFGLVAGDAAIEAAMSVTVRFD